jgi:ABC-type lipoprotein export system ATPase subunit
MSRTLIGATARGRAAGTGGATDTVIELRDVFCVHRTSEGDSAALQGLDIRVASGEQVCVLGPSGAGKTTLLRVIAGLQAPSAGVVRVLGSDIGRISARSRAKFRHATVGFLDQRAESALPPDLSVGQAVALPLLLRGVGRPARRARVGELLEAVALGDRADARPDQLSGGERQRVALCAALAHRPRLLLADEPTGELDDSAAETVRRLMAELARSEGATFVVVSHDALAAARAQRTVRIRDGRIVEDRRDGSPGIVVGRGGWLRLPPRLLERAGINDRAHVEPVQGGLVLTPADPAAVPPVRTECRKAPARGERVLAWEPALVELRSLSRSRGSGSRRRLVIDELSRVFAAGKMTAVAGRSGTGKTTLLRLLAGLDLPDAGELFVDRQRLTRLTAEQLARLRRERIGYLPQEPFPVGFLSAEENVTLALQLRGWDAERAARRATVVLARLGLGDRGPQRVARLSAGEAQRVALARALASAGGLLIVDEPTSRLDEAHAAAVAELLVKAAAEDAQTIVCASHDPEVIRCADHVLVLGRGG